MTLKSQYNQIKIKYRIIKDTYWFLIKNLKHNASIKTDESLYKMQYTILRENHIIEKGMSMKNPKDGFGIEKVINLLNRLNKYYITYYNEHDDFLEYPLSTIEEYIEYTHKNSNQDISIIENLFKSLKSQIKPYSPIKAGIKNVTRTEIECAAQMDFASLLYSRHSIRYFTSEPTKEELEKALRLASRTPSACNRQGWKTYIFNKNKCQEILHWQGGARGFEKDIPCCIIITASLNAFLEYEIFQAYIDGGMYAQNLINSLHFVGVGSIPLSCGFHANKLKQLTQWGIPEYEIPIIIIGCGKPSEQFKVAISTRKDISKTNKFIE